MIRDLPRDGRALRDRLARARVMLVFTPELCGARDPLEVLAAVLPCVDAVQVRPKALASAAGADIAADPPCAARETAALARAVLAQVRGLDDPPLVLVNDRVDVALALAGEGLAGVHLGQQDLPPEVARALCGEDLLLGLSTHDVEQVARAADAPVDYLGFGPAFATATKGYARGLGPEACWVATQGATRPLFPIGGITLERAVELEQVGRAAVGAALLAAPDPARAARELRELLG